ncbi:MAG: large-conductance mechanosensitive channel protein MscL [Sphaerochaetaceae bacterium]
MGKSKFFAEFKQFIARGNVMDMAVGIIVGSAFTAIVQSLVNDLLMPFIGLIIGGVNFTDLKWVISPAVGDMAAVTLNYGAFIQKCINFLLIAFVVFLMVKALNKMKELREKDTPPATPPAPPAPPADIALLTEIRDLLKK